MSVDTVVDLVALLRQSRLLEPQQLDEVVGSLQDRFPQPRALAGELLRRGWLTAFQINSFSRVEATNW
jgi:hypothetical protein